MTQDELILHIANNISEDRDFLHGLDFSTLRGKLFTMGDVVDGYENIHLKSETRVINGVEVPVPVKKKPLLTQQYWFPSVDDEDLVGSFFWGDNYTDNQIFNNSACFLNREDAILNAQAIFGVLK